MSRKEVKMTNYMNRSGTSGVYGYENSINSITVQFKNGSVYLYTYSSTGASHIEKMKQLASMGSGLNSFITTTVKKRYQAKLR